MSDKPIKILFVCVKKGVRASIAKGIMNIQGRGKVHASAASFEKGGIPQFLREEIIRFVEMPTDEVCKTVFEWNEFIEQFDYVITLCDESEEQCAIFNKITHTISSNNLLRRHWSIPNLSKAGELQGKDRTDFVAKVISKIATEVDNFIETENIKTFSWQ
ncbi:hypothetical protein HGP28_13145 [Vibrio sp. SM6]|uniref:Phosphotyrosine protein phosphatase I domain-containing protein n=1 Tax=Vibrio agarilyticus TaxID=2726741 RepID=A0A7X8YHY5_9VIBR|nr:hypothetical protein [Vibrio agarilyticus]NLS13837.1 hypothetical protein [Vibrio agarilyticus]